MKPYALLLSFLACGAVSARRSGAQRVLSSPEVQASTTIPFTLGIPGTLQKASGNVTLTVNSDGTVALFTRTQLFDREPSIFNRSWTFTDHKVGAANPDGDISQEAPHRCVLLGEYITTAAGVTIPITVPIPNSKSVAKGNATIGVQLDGKLHIDTILEATLEAGDRINSRAKDSIGVLISATGALREERCGNGEICMMPEVEIQIQEEDIDVRINGVDGSTAVDIFF